ncbi:TldD/PmbA family protein [Clostridium sp. UBA5119]|uniref:TldD/PmbA family protein n=1 Tax=Clostridium sp. UBA5119 TaxID=1946366 RepID=UPI003217DA98
MIISSLSKYSDLLKGYTELRHQENSSIVIGMMNGNLIQNVRASSSGISARAYVNGSWGFASNSNINDENIRQVLNIARQNGEFLNSKSVSKNRELVTTNYSIEKSFATKKVRLSQKQLIEFTKEIDNYIIKKYSNLISRSIRISELNMEKSLITSSGAELYSFLPRANIMIDLVINDGNGVPVELYEMIGGLGQFEDNFTNPQNLYERIDKIYERLRAKAEGVYANAGLKECILATDLAGILAHEAVGHTTEADFVLSGSIAGEYMDKEVASSLITLVDYANTAFGNTCPVPIYIDDEGTKAEDVTIIENGILKRYMHNKESANMFNAAPTGNARAYEFSDEPIIRMRNTCILPGKDKLEDMISSVEDGYYLMNPSNGQADATSEFMFGVSMGYEIKNGKLSKAIRDTTISGVAFDMLKTVTMVSDDLTWLNGGMCGKKQPITVGMGGPAMKCKINIGGK